MWIIVVVWKSSHGEAQVRSVGPRTVLDEKASARSSARYARNGREHPGGCDCCQLSLNVFHRGILRRHKKPHKGRARLVWDAALWENRRQKTATQINYKLSHVERDAADERFMRNE